MTTVDSWPKTLPMLSAWSWNSTTETHLNVAVTGVVLPAKKSTLYCKLRNKWSFIKRSHNHMFQGNQTDSTLEFCCEIVASCLGYQILALCRWSTTFNLLASFKATQSITGLGVVSEIYFWNTRVKLFILKRKLLLTLYTPFSNLADF